MISCLTALKEGDKIYFHPPSNSEILLFVVFKRYSPYSANYAEVEGMATPINLRILGVVKIVKHR